MNEKELIEKKFSDTLYRFKNTSGPREDVVWQNTAHSVFLSCVVNKSLDPIKCAKFMLVKDKSLYKLLCLTLLDFPEFELKVKQELEKLLALI